MHLFLSHDYQFLGRGGQPSFSTQQVPQTNVTQVRAGYWFGFAKGETKLITNGTSTSLQYKSVKVHIFIDTGKEL